jgi:hypothetical protein
MVLRLMYNDKEHNLHQLGYKLKVGEIMKFGRVRYRVIMMHDQRHGL